MVRGNHLASPARWYGKCHSEPLPTRDSPDSWSFMPKPMPNRGPDPMAGVVDRLLAQLPGLQGQPEPPRSSPYRPAMQTGMAGATPRTAAVGNQRQVLGMWIRVLLGLSLGMMMGWWPYARACGFPLFGYLGAVTTVIMAGWWAAVASWKIRSGLAHTLSLILLLYGFMLAGSELLPRTGYSVERATWECQDVGSAPATVLSLGFDS
jgi:hypothetical protein